MIKKLKRRFIILAMASLTALMSVVVAGMNIINYEAIISEADQTLEMLSDNRGRFPLFIGNNIEDAIDAMENLTGQDEYPERGRRKNKISRDEAEGMRFFTVLVNKQGESIMVNTDRIYAIDTDAAGDMAEAVVASGKTSGFNGVYRYLSKEEGSCTRVTFLDCSNSLDSFWTFLYASLGMGVAGLAVLFVIIVYFAGRIVKPAAESYDKQKRFITDAGHEIKTPLTIIKANIDVMKMDIEDGIELTDAASRRELSCSLNESLDDITGQVERLTTLTNDLVYLSRMEEAEGAIVMTQVPLSDIVSDTASSFYPVAAERKKELVLDIEPMISIQGSTKELEKLVSILVENALKYSPEEDEIRIRLYREGKTAVLETRNSTLEPLSENDLEHVFERFYRTDKSRNSSSGGHGIGLSVASAIVSAHGGRIRASSGNGNEFVVTASFAR